MIRDTTSWRLIRRCNFLALLTNAGPARRHIFLPPAPFIQPIFSVNFCIHFAERFGSHHFLICSSANTSLLKFISKMFPGLLNILKHVCILSGKYPLSAFLDFFSYYFTYIIFCKHIQKRKILHGSE